MPLKEEREKIRAFQEGKPTGRWDRVFILTSRTLSLSAERIHGQPDPTHELGGCNSQEVRKSGKERDLGSVELFGWETGISGASGLASDWQREPSQNPAGFAGDGDRDNADLGWWPWPPRQLKASVSLHTRAQLCRRRRLHLPNPIKTHGAALAALPPAAASQGAN